MAPKDAHPIVTELREAITQFNETAKLMQLAGIDLTPKCTEGELILTREFNHLDAFTCSFIEVGLGFEAGEDGVTPRVGLYAELHVQFDLENEYGYGVQFVMKNGAWIYSLEDRRPALAKSSDAAGQETLLGVLGFDRATAVTDEELIVLCAKHAAQLISHGPPTSVAN